MGRRLFNGRRFSENGWPYVDRDGCDWIIVRGSVPPVNLQLQQGPPAVVLGAWAADWNAHIEPLRDEDSAGWTEGNSVATSNHPGGTAIDLNWKSHAFRVRGTLNGAQMVVLDEMEDFYERNVFWAGRWQDPVDEMHSQVGYGTYDQANDRPDPKVLDFIARKIRPDGYSTFRRGDAPEHSSAALILARATGLTLERATVILPTMSAGLVQAECTNPRRIAMFVAQTGEESAAFNATEEYASGDAYDTRTDLGNTPQVDGDGRLYKGRSWIMITGHDHYAEFSEWAHGKGLVPTPTYFVDHPTELSDMRWAGIGAAWYWTVARPFINSLCDAGDLLGVTRAINGGTNGLADRTARYSRAIALGDELLQLLDPTELDEWEQLMADPTKYSSRSCYRTSNEKTMTTLDALFGADATSYNDWVEHAAERGEAWAIDEVRATARGEGAGATRWDDNTQIDQWAVGHAQAVLAHIEAVNPAALQAYLGKAPA